MYEVPAGMVGEHESALNAAVRVLAEKVGIEADPSDLENMSERTFEEVNFIILLILFLEEDEVFTTIVQEIF
jgi:ADP-ribose pyrophosphatase YjhB (NUDIX family)